MPRGEYDRGARKAQTRAALLGAAARVYARRGVAGATLDEVAAEAGYSKGAVYAHFGSKENLLLALLGEHLSEEVAEQLSLFDREQPTWDRPLRGSERWMEHLQDDPDAFRLFVELWSNAQRDERVREGLAGGLDLLRSTFSGFAAAGAADAGVDAPQGTSDGFAEVTLALGIGLAMVRLIDGRAANPALLGTALSLLVRALESSAQARDALAGAMASPRAAAP